MLSYDYTTHPISGTVHLVPPFADRTLCGKVWQPDWKDGDETVSGVAATCDRCRSIAKDRSR